MSAVEAEAVATFQRHRDRHERVGRVDRTTLGRASEGGLLEGAVNTFAGIGCIGLARTCDVLFAGKCRVK